MAGPMTLEDLEKMELDAPDGKRMTNRDRNESMRKSEVVADVEEAPVEIDEILMAKAVTPRQRAIHRFNDDMLMAAMLLKRNPTKLKRWQHAMMKGSRLRKALDSETATEGSEWIPTNFSTTVIDYVDGKNPVTAMLNRIEMPTDPFKMPFINAQIAVQKIGEQTGDAGTKLADVGGAPSNNMTLNAVKFGGRVPLSTELTEDAAFAVVTWIRGALMESIGRGRDYATINGDSDGAHQDSDIGASATHRGVLWNGFRKHALSSASFNMSLSTFNRANLTKLISLMGRYAGVLDDLLWVTGPKVYHRHIASLDDVSTKEKYGDQATVLTGEVAKLYGIPVVISNQFREDLATNGRYDGTTTDNGALLLVYRPGWFWGIRRNPLLKVWENIEYDQQYFTITAREHVITPWTADPVAVMGIDIDLS